MTAKCAMYRVVGEAIAPGGKLECVEAHHQAQALHDEEGDDGLGPEAEVLCRPALEEGRRTLAPHQVFHYVYDPARRFAVCMLGGWEGFSRGGDGDRTMSAVASRMTPYRVSIASRPLDS